MTKNKDPFFDEFEDLLIDWGRITPEQLEQLINTLKKQDAEKVYKELCQAILVNENKKAIVKVATTILQTLVSLGIKVL